LLTFNAFFNIRAHWNTIRLGLFSHYVKRERRN